MNKKQLFKEIEELDEILKEIELVEKGGPGSGRKPGSGDHRDIADPKARLVSLNREHSQLAQKWQGYEPKFQGTTLDHLSRDAAAAGPKSDQATEVEWRQDQARLDQLSYQMQNAKDEVDAGMDHHSHVTLF